MNKAVTKKSENKVKEQKIVFLILLVATLGASLLESRLSGEGVTSAGGGVIWAGKDKIRAGQDF